jgi:SAM-dependent methyltransferase
MSGQGGGGFTRDKCLEFLAGAEHARADGRVEIAISAAAGTPREAVDLGCGPGHETLAMLRAGFRVLAIDAHVEAVDATRTRAERSGAAGRLWTRVERIERLVLDPGRHGLIHARFALPFVPAPEFPRLWANLRAALAPGGVLACQLFGPDDGFVHDGSFDPRELNVHASAEVDALLAGLETIHREEVNRDGVTALGVPKHWHVHHLIVQRF